MQHATSSQHVDHCNGLRAGFIECVKLLFERYPLSSVESYENPRVSQREGDC